MKVFRLVMNRLRKHPAVTPVVATILVVTIVLSVSAAVLIWGIPYIERTKANAQQNNLYSQFKLLKETASNLLNEGPGATEENRFSLADGTLNVERRGSRIVTYYSLDSSHDFYVYGLNDTDSNFNLEMVKGNCDSIKVYWLGTHTAFTNYNPPQKVEPVTSNPQFPGYYSRTKICNFSNSDASTNYTTKGKKIPFEYGSENYTDVYSASDIENISHLPNFNRWFGDAGDSQNPDGYYFNAYYKFKIFNYTVGISDIQKIEIDWLGHDTLYGGGNFSIYIWNTSKWDWDLLNSTGTGEDTDRWYNHTIDRGFENYTLLDSSENKYVVIGISGGKNIGLPSVVTENVSSLGEYEATLEGNLLSLGNGSDSCDVWFQYRESDSSVWENTSRETKDEEGSFSETITGLSPGTTYYFRAVAENDAGTIYGDEKSFTTYKPPSVTTQDAENVESTTATLKGYLDDPGIPKDSCQVWFQWGTTTSYGHETSKTWQSAAGTFSVDISNLSPGTTYHFRAVAENDAGIRYGEDKKFTTKTPVAHIGFIEGTKITMADGGVKDISEIREGDRVMTYDPRTGKFVPGKVVKIFPEEVTFCYMEISLENKILLKAAPGQLILVNNRWLPAGELREGDLLLDQDGNAIAVESVKEVSTAIPNHIYSFIVESEEKAEGHTYIANHMVVHDEEEPHSTEIPSGFLEDTEITMADGKVRNIREIREGDRVMTYDPRTGKFDSSVVTKVFSDMATDYYLRIESELGRLDVTPNHLILVNGTWIIAGKIEVGDLLLGEGGKEARVKSIEEVDYGGRRVVWVYNFDVADTHTYIANHTVVHNKGSRYDVPDEYVMLSSDAKHRTSTKSYSKEVEMLKLQDEMHADSTRRLSEDGEVWTADKIFADESVHHTLYETYVQIKVTYKTYDAEPPSTNITNISSLPEKYYSPDEITISWTGKDDVSDPEDLVYKYRLDPIETEWQPLGGVTTNTSITYRASDFGGKFPRGNYTFRVRARDESGKWEVSENVFNTYRFSIIPANDTLPVNVRQGENKTIHLSEDMDNDFVLIELYEGGKLFGRIWSMDFSILKYTLNTASGTYGVSFANGAIVLNSPNGNFIKEPPYIRIENNKIYIHFIQFNAPYGFGVSGSGANLAVSSRVTDSGIREQREIYSLKIYVSGEDQTAWERYLQAFYNFEKEKGSLAYSGDYPVDLTMVHTIIDIQQKS